MLLVIFPSLLLLLVGSRIVFLYFLQISPDVDPTLLLHWQTLPLKNLYEDFWLEILNLHSQPPLWNMVLGATAHVCKAALPCVGSVLHLFNMLLTLGVAMMIATFIVQSGRSHLVGLIAAGIYILLPSTVFYENYIFYPHLTMFLCSTAIFSLYAWWRHPKRNYLAGFLISIVALGWIGAIFHPLFMSGVVVVAFYLRGLFRPATIAPAILASLLIFAPSVKNQFVFGFFGESSWLGLNLSQVAPNMANDCTFESFRAAVPGDISPGVAFNDISVIPFAENCKNEAINLILEHPQQYIAGRILAGIRSSMKTPADYFFPPLGFENYPRISGYSGGYNGLRDENGRLNISVLSGFSMKFVISP